MRCLVDTSLRAHKSIKAFVLILKVMGKQWQVWEGNTASGELFHKDISGGRRISVLRKIVALDENRDLGWGDWVGRARKLRIKLIVLVIDWTWGWGRQSRCQEWSLDFFLAVWWEEVREMDYYVGVTTPLPLGHSEMTLPSVWLCFISNSVCTELELEKHDAVRSFSKVTGKRSNPISQVWCARQSWAPEFQW